ncbi:hypothetical protein [Pelagibaculum spongiae]|uniref:Uncharacterized protein n=1 Tax=Pelagibaculum spongiae TaxID=2080658 RepID=A0A2V1H2G5_9GAMM|nr:hypothetical protein [Pelagibaculum spongiae]PVZ69487.1 hypothetical protein DC094_09150 [Pelagibaculum spongiae]
MTKETAPENVAPETTAPEKAPAKKATVKKAAVKKSAPKKAPAKKAVVKKDRKRPESVQLMSDYFSENRSIMPQNIGGHREEIIALIMQGLSPEEAFSQFVKT